MTLLNDDLEQCIKRRDKTAIAGNIAPDGIVKVVHSKSTIASEKLFQQPDDHIDDSLTVNM